MKVIRSITAMQRITNALQRRGKCIGFVPTMGALHEGHLSLIRRAKRDNDVVVVSIFVNPAQFGPAEDLQRYPRSFSQDTVLCAKAGVTYLFYPQAQAMYPKGFRTYTEVTGLSDVCFAANPGRGISGVLLRWL